MKKNKVGDLIYSTFESFDSTGLVNHCFSTRFGGVSSGVYESMNLGFSRGDKRENVEENFRRICEAIGSDFERSVKSRKQIHSTNVYAATEKDRGTTVDDMDGFVTNVPGVLLVTFHADCVPLFFLDPVKKAIGLSHAGWRGTVDGMAGATIEKMREVYGSNPGDILAGIGPSIGKCCFQVDMPVVEEFREKLSFADEFITADESQRGKFKIDLWGVNARLMTLSGVREDNISVDGTCTKCRTDLYFSHRAMGESRGQMAAFLELKE